MYCSLSFLDLWFDSFYYFWKILGHYLFKCFFCSILSLLFDVSITHTFNYCIIIYHLDILFYFLSFFTFFLWIFSSVQLLSPVWLFVTSWTTECQASLSITNSQSLLKLMSIMSVMPSNHLILYCPLLPLPSVFPSIRVFSKESVLCIRWSKYWSFSFSISPSNEYSGIISFRADCWISLQSKGLSRVFSNTGVQKHQLFSAQLCL